MQSPGEKSQPDEQGFIDRDKTPYLQQGNIFNLMVDDEGQEIVDEDLKNEGDNSMEESQQGLGGNYVSTRKIYNSDLTKKIDEPPSPRRVWQREVENDQTMSIRILKGPPDPRANYDKVVDDIRRVSISKNMVESPQKKQQAEGKSTSILASALSPTFTSLNNLAKQVKEQVGGEKGKNNSKKSIVIKEDRNVHHRIEGRPGRDDSNQSVSKLAQQQQQGKDDKKVNQNQSNGIEQEEEEEEDQSSALASKYIPTQKFTSLKQLAQQGMSQLQGKADVSNEKNSKVQVQSTKDGKDDENELEEEQNASRFSQYIPTQKFKSLKSLVSQGQKQIQDEKKNKGNVAQQRNNIQQEDDDESDIDEQSKEPSRFSKYIPTQKFTSLKQIAQQGQKEIEDSKRGIDNCSNAVADKYDVQEDSDYVDEEIEEDDPQASKFSKYIPTQKFTSLKKMAEQGQQQLKEREGKNQQINSRNQDEIMEKGKDDYVEENEDGVSEKQSRFSKYIPTQKFSSLKQLAQQGISMMGVQRKSTSNSNEVAKVKKQENQNDAVQAHSTSSTSKQNPIEKQYQDNSKQALGYIEVQDMNLKQQDIKNEMQAAKINLPLNHQFINQQLENSSQVLQSQEQTIRHENDSLSEAQIAFYEDNNSDFEDDNQEEDYNNGQGLGNRYKPTMQIKSLKSLTQKGTIDQDSLNQKSSFYVLNGTTISTLPKEVSTQNEEYVDHEGYKGNITH